MTASRNLRLALSFGLPLLVACGTDSEPPTLTVRDSAGVTIVENRAPSWRRGQEWRVTEPTLQVGMVDGPPEYAFHGVVAGGLLSDGTIVVADAGAHQLRFYSPEGRFVRAAGRQGEGPGEFGYLSGVVVMRGDSLVAYDQGQRRASVFLSDGRLVRELTIQIPPEMMATPASVLPSGNGSFLVPTTGFLAPAPHGVQRPLFPVFRLAADGRTLEELGSFRGDEEEYRTVQGGISRSTIPFGRRSYVAAHGERFFVGDSEQFEIAVHGRAGELELLIRRDHPARPITPADLAAFIEQTLVLVPQEYREALRGRFQEAPLPDRMPVYSGFLTDPDGNLWVAVHRGPRDADPPVWSVFDPSGVLLGDVEVPRGLRILEIGREHLLGVWKDELDVEYLRLHRLEKGS